MPTISSTGSRVTAGTLFTGLVLCAGKEITLLTSGTSILLSTYYSCRAVWERATKQQPELYQSFSPQTCILISTVGGTVLGIVAGAPLAGTITGFGISSGCTLVTKVVGTAQKILLQ